jgi:hypothetical protein
MIRNAGTPGVFAIQHEPFPVPLRESVTQVMIKFAGGSYVAACCSWEFR